LLVLLLAAPACADENAHDGEALYVTRKEGDEEALAALKELVGAERWDEAAAAALAHVADGLDGMAEVEDGRYVSFAERVRREVLTWPGPGRRAFDALCEDAAGGACDEAIAARDIRALAEVSGRTLPSATGARALAALAEVRAERGELRAARRALGRSVRITPNAALKSKLEALDEGIETQRPAPASAEWPALGGGPARSGLAPVCFDIGLERWAFDVAEADVDGEMADGLRARGLRVPRPAHPVLGEKLAFIQTTRSLSAVDAKTGRLVWRYPDEPTGPDPRGRVDVVAAPFLWRDRVLAFVDDRVVALSAASGAVLWATGGLTGEDPPPEVLVNSLVIGAGRVFVCANTVKGETEALVVALDARDGKVVWRRKLCSQVFRGYAGRGSHPAPPAFADGSVVVSTNLGAVAALDATTGEVRWLARYRAFSPLRRRWALREDACWRNNPPVIAGGLVIVAPQDADDVLAFDTDTGRSQWRAPRRNMRHLAGAAGGKVFLSGRRAAALDARTGRLLWESQELGAPAGRPILAAGALLIPTQNGLVKVDAENGEVLWVWRSPSPREVGNLALTDGLLLSASYDRVNAFGDASAMEADDADTEGTLRRAERLGRLGNVRGALDLYAAALASAEERETVKKRVRTAMAEAHLRVGRARARAGRLAEAERAFVLARRRAPGSQAAAEATFAIAEGREKQGQWAPALATYRYALGHSRGRTVDVAGVRLPARIVAEARIRSLLAGHPPDGPEEADARPVEPGKKRFVQVWRTAVDTARAAPTVLATSDAFPRPDEPFVLVATRDRGEGHAFLWDAVECRRVGDGRVLWRTDVGPFQPRAVAAGERLVVAGPFRLSALDARSGKVLWTTGAGTGEPSRLVDCVAGKDAVFTSTAAEVFATEADTGDERWRARLPGPVLRGSMCVRETALVVCTENPGAVLWLDARSGRTLHEMRVRAEDARLTDTPALQLRSDRLCLVVGDRRVEGLALGGPPEVLWTRAVGFPVGRIASTPDEKLLLVFPDRWAVGGEVTCLDATSGEVLWEAPPATGDPSEATVDDTLLLGIRKGIVADALVARFLSGQEAGSVAWERPLPGRPVFNRVVRAGEFFVATGAAIDLSGPLGLAAVLRASDGGLVAPLRRPGARYASPVAVGDTLILCTQRGIDAYRTIDTDAALRRLAVALPDADREPAAALEVAWPLAGRGEHEKAMAFLERLLLAEAMEPGRSARVHACLAALREATCEAQRPVYEAPLFRRPPQMDGRLREDWRADRAARLDRARHIERLQSRAPADRIWSGPNDLSATLYVAWDAEHLYVTVDVRDDIHTVHDFDAEKWTGDCLLVAIDPEHDGGYRPQGLDTVFWLGLAAKQRAPGLPDAIGGEHSVKVKEDESGTIYEIALPWRDLWVSRPQPGTRLGLNVMVIDDDGRGTRKGVSWAPGLTQNRRRELMVDGLAPSLFGTVILKEN